jgi:hypothetical protein
MIEQSDAKEREAKLRVKKTHFLLLTQSEARPFTVDN